MKLKALDRPRVSVNSFGYGGTNAHAILDAARRDEALPPLADEGGEDNASLSGKDSRSSQHSESSTGFVYVDRTDGRSPTLDLAEHERRPYLFVLSAQSERSLSGLVRSLYNFTSRTNISNRHLEGLAYTLSLRRDKWRWRSTVVAFGCKELIEQQLQMKEHRSTRASGNLRTFFVFTGQGAQWYAMGRELLVTYPHFARSMQQCDHILKRLGADWSLLEELSRDEGHSKVHQSKIGQPACTAIQLSLVTLLESFGVKADAVLGHSSGEIAAAFACSALSLEMAMMVSYRRGILPVKGTGAMVAVALGEAEAERFVAKLRSGQVCVACVNSPYSTTMSGDKAAIVELEQLLDAIGVSNTRLKVDTAFHSPHMQLVAEQYYRSLEDLQYGTLREPVSFFSSVTGQQKTSGFGPAYWAENLVSKVRFNEALHCLCDTQGIRSMQSSSSSANIFIECGPHNTLSNFSTQSTVNAFGETFPFHYFSCLRKKENAVVTILDLAGRLFELGYSLEFSAIHTLREPHVAITDFEPYSWDHSQTYWHESRLSKENRFRKHGYHELLGLRKVNSTSLEPSWRNILSLAYLPWLEHHAIDGCTIFPGSAYLCMAIEALRQTNESRGTPDISGRYLFKDVSFKRTLAVPSSPAGIEIQLSLSAVEDLPKWSEKNWENFRVFSLSQDDVWQENCRGAVVFESTTTPKFEIDPEHKVTEVSRLPSLEDLKSTCTQDIDVQSLYDELQQKGNHYGPTFTRLKKLGISNNHSIGSVDIVSNSNHASLVNLPAYLIHPAALDALLHASIPLYMQQCQADSVMTLGVAELSISTSVSNAPDTELLVASSLVACDSGRAKGEIAAFRTAMDSSPELVVHFVDSEFRGRGKKPVTDNKVSDHPCIQWGIKWEPDVDFARADMFVADPIMKIGETSAEAKLEALDQLATLHIHNVFQTVSGLSSSFSVLKDHRAHLIGWMQRHMSSAYSQKIIRATPASDIEQLRSKVRKEGPEGEMMCRIGENLSAILVDGADPLPIMLEDDLLYRLYADGASTKCYEHLMKYFRHLVFKYPCSTILEIGAGTAGATLPVLRSVRKDELLINRYDFTDVSQGFFEHAQTLLQEWQHILRYKTLDIGKDPTGQGFQDGEYDLVIASNAIHATPCIDDAIANIRKLLRPGGTLILIEMTRTTPWYNTCFGCLPGWWAGRSLRHP